MGINIDEHTARRLDLYVRTLREIASDTGNGNAVVSAKYETLSLFYGPLQNCFRKETNTLSLRKPGISSEFFTLLKKYFKTEQHLSFYSDRLNITDRYLYVCVVSVTGKNPSYWIDYYIMLEAKKLLLENSLSVSQIANELGFSGPAQFGKFFKRLSGETATAFRKNYSG